MRSNSIINLKIKKLPAYFLDQSTLQNNPNKCEKTFSQKLNNEIHEHNTMSINEMHKTRTSHSFAQNLPPQSMFSNKNT